MLDKKSRSVLEILKEQVGFGYKVVNKRELFACLPQKPKTDFADFLSIVAFLKENDYIVVKYQDKNDICLTVTVKAANELEAKPTQEKRAIPFWQIALLLLGAFVTSFLGALTANFLYALR